MENNITAALAAADLHFIVLIILMFLTSYVFPFIKKSSLPIKHLQLSSFFIKIMILCDGMFLFFSKLKLPNFLILTKISRSITLFAVLIMLYIVADLLYKLLAKKSSSTLIKVVTFIPVIAEIIALICNITYPIYFEINADYTYVKLPLEVVHNLLSYFYALYTLVFAIKYRKNIGKNALLIFFGVVPLPYIISISNLIFNLNFQVYPFVALGLAFALLGFKNSNSLIDPITKLKNYAFFYQDLNKDKLKEDNYIIALLDLDKLDDINSMYSYKEGDLLLEFIANTFSDNIPSNSEVYFAGQDEFIFAFKNKSIEEVELFFNDFKLFVKNTQFAKTKKYAISFTTVIEQYNNEKYESLLDITKYLYYKMFKAKSKKQVSN